RAIRIKTNSVTLDGDLEIPEHSTSLVIFAHGSGSSRFSGRNRHVAAQFNQLGIGTLLMDLLTPDEEQVDLKTSHIRFDIGLLAQRVVGTIDFLKETTFGKGLHLGIFGASTGAAASLIAAADRPKEI